MYLKIFFLLKRLVRNYIMNLHIHQRLKQLPKLMASLALPTPHPLLSPNLYWMILTQIPDTIHVICKHFIMSL